MKFPIIGSSTKGILDLRNQSTLCYLFLLLSFHVEPGSAGNPDAKRLYDDLLSNYNKLVRPVINVTDALTVKIKLKLSQLIDVVSIKIFCFSFRPSYFDIDSYNMYFKYDLMISVRFFTQVAYYLRLVARILLFCYASII